jgi:hypothetical protein
VTTAGVGVHAVQEWLQVKHVDTLYGEPGGPWQKAYSESINSDFRAKGLVRCVFRLLTQALVVINLCLEEYNTIRPHGLLDGFNPETFIQNGLKTIK